jgi:hypothetical protein
VPYRDFARSLPAAFVDPASRREMT